MRVLVTDSDNRSALAATRSLGRAGYEVLVMGEREASIAAASRYCSRFLPCPSPIDTPDAFLAAVLGRVPRTWRSTAVADDRGHHAAADARACAATRRLRVAVRR